MSAVLELDDIAAATADAATRFGRDHYALAQRHRLPASQRRFDPSRWNEMAAMGWFGLACEEADGGLGLQVAGICELACAAGAWNMNEPLVSTGAVGADVIRLCASELQRGEWLPQLLAGRLRVACAFAPGEDSMRADRGALTGVREVVVDADIADLLLVETGGRWHAVDPKSPGVGVEPYPLADGRGAATLTLEGCVTRPLPRENGSRHSALLAALATSADSVGAMETAFALTLEHIKTRRQFGAPLAANQVVAHRAVDMYLRLQECRALLARATRALAEHSARSAMEVHAAKAFIGPQARFLAQEAVQLHGGIGMTEEGGVSHCLRRAMVNEQVHGTAREHLLHFAAQGTTR